MILKKKKNRRIEDNEKEDKLRDTIRKRKVKGKKAEIGYWKQIEEERRIERIERKRRISEEIETR